MILVPNHDSEDEHFFADQRHAALSYLSEAFEEARLDGIETEYLVHAALFAAFKELVSCYGEEAVATYAERLPERIRQGEFSIVRSRQ